MEEPASLVYRHSRIARITHWTCSIAFLALAGSGAQIFFHLHWPYWSAKAVHLGAALVMVASGVVNVTSRVIGNELDQFLFLPSDAAACFAMAQYYLKLRAEPPAHGKYNPLQKAAYSLALLALGPLIAITGFAMWPHLAAARPLAAAFGGKHGVQWWHIGLGLGLVMFFLGHILMVVTTGLRNNLASMVTGYRLESGRPAR